MSDPLDAFRRQGEIDAATPLPIPVDWKARAEKAERERDVLREALANIVVVCGGVPLPDRFSLTNRIESIARAALEAKP